MRRQKWHTRVLSPGTLTRILFWLKEELPLKVSEQKTRLADERDIRLKEMCLTHISPVSVAGDATHTYSFTFTPCGGNVRSKEMRYFLCFCFLEDIFRI